MTTRTPFSTPWPIIAAGAKGICRIGWVMAAVSQPGGVGCSPDDVTRAIREHRLIALIGHVTPDADCLGSIGALWLALPELGKYPFVAMPAGSVSRKLEFLIEM